MWLVFSWNLVWIFVHFYFIFQRHIKWRRIVTRPRSPCSCVFGARQWHSQLKEILSVTSETEPAAALCNIGHAGLFREIACLYTGSCVTARCESHFTLVELGGIWFTSDMNAVRPVGGCARRRRRKTRSIVITPESLKKETISLSYVVGVFFVCFVFILFCS